MDLLTESPDGKVIITDWKTGRDDVDGNNMQLSVYILWGHKKLGIPLERLAGECVYLKTGKSRCIAITEKEMHDIEDLIKTSSLEMLAVKSEKDFPASPYYGKCRSCNFMAICDEGRKEVGK